MGTRLYGGDSQSLQQLVYLHEICKNMQEYSVISINTQKYSRVLKYMQEYSNILITQVVNLVITCLA